MLKIFIEVITHKCSPKINVHLKLQNGNLFGNSIFADIIIKVTINMRSYEMRVDPESKVNVLTKYNKRHTEASRKTCEDRGRD